MTTGQLLLGAWDWQPSVLVGCVALLVAYAVAVRPLAWRTAAFITGVVVLLLALISPIDTLGDGYLFSAHMLQHLLLMLVVPPLLLYGLPPNAFAQVLRWGLAGRVEQAVGRPLLAWLIGIGTLWVWHAPPLYDLALRYEGVHIVQHLCFLVAATIFWWPVMAPLPQRRRLSSFAAMPYLLAAALSSSVLGIVITFAPTGLYAPYLHPFDRLGALALIRGQWHFSVQSDQQLGGAMMWMLTSPVYLGATALALGRWYGEGEGDDVETAPAPARAAHAEPVVGYRPFE